MNLFLSAPAIFLAGAFVSSAIAAEWFSH